MGLISLSGKGVTMCKSWQSCMEKPTLHLTSSVLIVVEALLLIAETIKQCEAA